MKYRIVKETYADQTNKFYVQQKSFLFWKPIDTYPFSYHDLDNMPFYYTLEYKFFGSYESAEEALNVHILMYRKNNKPIKTKVAATFKTK